MFVANILGEEPNFPRRVIGFTNLDAVGFGGAPSAKFFSLFEDRWRNPATNELSKVNQWFGWYDMPPAGGWIARSKTYLLLHRGHEAFRLERGLGPYSCTARGLWTLRGSQVDIAWDDGTPNQSWIMATTYSPKMATTGTPRTSNTGKITRVVQIPPGKVPPEIMPSWRVE